MKCTKLRVGLLVTCLALLAMPLVVVHSAGGRIEGKVIDPKGAIVVGATVTVTDPETNKTFTAITDQQGRYKIEGLPAKTLGDSPNLASARNSRCWFRFTWIWGKGG